MNSEASPCQWQRSVNCTVYIHGGLAETMLIRKTLPQKIDVNEIGHWVSDATDTYSRAELELLAN